MAHALSAVSAEDASESEQTEDAGNGKVRRALGPKTVYIQLREGTAKDAILSVHTNTRTLVDSMEQTPGSSYVKHTLPQGEPRQKRS